MEKLPRRVVLQRGLGLLAAVTTGGIPCAVDVFASSCTRPTATETSAPTETLTSTVTIGAIRWDGWFLGSEWQEYLNHSDWIPRYPYYTRMNQNGKIEIHADTQDIMNQDIQFAKKAGLSYFAFCWYPPDSADLNRYNNGLNLYLASEAKRDLHFSLILQGQHLGKKDEWNKTTDTILEYLKKPPYQTVLDGRPLVYVYDVESMVRTFGDTQTTERMIDYLRKKAQAVGTKNPFLVAQNASGFYIHLGFDALGAYTANGSGPHKELPYSDLVQANYQYSERSLRDGKQIVPTVNAGWDPRPLLDHPTYGNDYKSGPWYTQPSPQELAIHIQRTKEWVAQNPSCSSAQTVLICAWNELNEGGWLVPTLVEGDARVNELSRISYP